MGAGNSTQSGTASYDLVVQTVFTPPASCTTGGVTMMSISSTHLWNNAIVPATGVTSSGCYPSQFWSSAVATSTTLPPFKQLICPQTWQEYDFNSTYIICCPPRFGIYAPNFKSQTDQPALGALCTSWIGKDVLYDVTSWNSASFVTIVPATGPATGTLLFATPFHGTPATTTISQTSNALVSSTATSVYSTSISQTFSASVTLTVSHGTITSTSG